jgi:hypothetical protein
MVVLKVEKLVVEWDSKMVEQLVGTLVALKVVV